MTDTEYEQYIVPCRQMLQDGKTMEDVLNYLRKETNSKGACVAILINGLHIPYSDAKRLVHFSEAWKDMKDRDEKFHEDLFSALEEIDKEE